MADYLTSNRNEIEKFVHEAGDVFHWDHYFNFLGVLELDINVEAIMTRTRNAIKVRMYVNCKNVRGDSPLKTGFLWDSPFWDSPSTCRHSV